MLAELVAAGGGDAGGDRRGQGLRGDGHRRALEALVDDAIAANEAAWAKYAGGEDKAIGALVGAVMKATRGQADGQAVTALLRARRAA